MAHPGQSHNVVIYMRADIKHDWEDVSSIFPIASFSLPDLILHARHIHACFELPRVWFLSLQYHKGSNYSTGTKTLL